MSGPIKEQPETTAADPRRWRMLGLLAVAQFMLILDVTVVAIALPHIGTDLGLDRETLTWVVSAYTLMFGGLMLLGGRAADLFGSRKVVLAGLAVFTAASLVTGLANGAELLIGGRIAQGIGAAMLSPAALSMVTKTFDGDERNKALGIWSAIGGGGSAIGVLLGGVLTAGPGWQWVFYVNVPIGVIVFAILLKTLPADRPTESQGRLDVPGAILVTAGTGTAIYALINAGDRGWLSRRDPGHAGRRGRPVRRLRVAADGRQVAADGPPDPDPPPGRRRDVPDPGRDRADDRGLLPRARSTCSTTWGTAP